MILLANEMSYEMSYSHKSILVLYQIQETNNLQQVLKNEVRLYPSSTPRSLYRCTNIHNRCLGDSAAALDGTYTSIGDYWGLWCILE